MNHQNVSIGEDFFIYFRVSMNLMLQRKAYFHHHFCQHHRRYLCTWHHRCQLHLHTACRLLLCLLLILQKPLQLQLLPLRCPLKQTVLSVEKICPCLGSMSIL